MESCDSVRWAAQSSGTIEGLYGVTFQDSNTGWAVGADGTTLRTSDGGNTWSVSGDGGPEKLHSWKAVSFHGPNTGWAVGSSGSIIHTGDGGATWTLQPNWSPDTASAWQGVQALSSSLAFCVGSQGYILKTIDGGATWEKMRTQSFRDLYGLYFHDAYVGWAVGYAGTILHTTDGGNSWRSQSSGTPRWLKGVHFTTRYEGWAVGQAGTIVHTTDGGESWEPQTACSTVDLYDVTLTLGITTEGFAVGDDGTFCYTTSTGKVWFSNYEHAAAGRNLRSISQQSPSELWTVGTSGLILTFTGIIEFDGIDTFLQIPVHEELRAVSLWLFASSVQYQQPGQIEAQCLLDAGHEGTMASFNSRDDQNNIWHRLFIDGANVTVAWSSIPSDEWIHVHLEAKRSITAAITLMCFRFFVNCLRGMLAEVYTWDRALSAAELGELVVASFDQASKGTGLLSFYQLQEGAGKRVYDVLHASYIAPVELGVATPGVGFEAGPGSALEGFWNGDLGERLRPGEIRRRSTPSKGSLV
ncbi:hypothetical protein CYMTET_14816 [Cymbomonas tetramitiformis]|uniref:Photosynthesis system II assembly factor Ycf48/Hcf136-like domain-containing protein n=1 Tax=Cymbomonas tetramitiformis TaxID=36881 RepID=A0AAE0LA00_9CHLO|nr:hypothetical protein CYMTET_14816 [Cymbomonas tetramitiformis]